MSAIKFAILGIFLFSCGCSVSTDDNVKQGCLSFPSKYPVMQGKNQSQKNEYCSCVSRILASKDMPAKEAKHISDIFGRVKSGTDLYEAVYAQQRHGMNIVEAQEYERAIGAVLQTCDK